MASFLEADIVLAVSVGVAAVISAAALVAMGARLDRTPDRRRLRQEPPDRPRR
jgi:hypothetical protein